MILRRTYQLEGEPGGINGVNGVGATAQAPPDYAGYPSVEALVSGYKNSGAEAQRWRQRALELEAALTPAPKPADNPYDQLSNYGLPVESLREVIGREIQNQFAPLAKGISARSTVLSRYPDYQKFEAEVANFINQDPATQQAYNAMFNADPAGAMEFAFLKFGDHQRRTAPPDAGKGQERGKQADAAIPSRGGAPNRQADDGDLTQRAWDHYQKTKDPSAFIKARLRKAIPDSFYEK